MLLASWARNLCKTALRGAPKVRLLWLGAHGRITSQEAEFLSRAHFHVGRAVWSAEAGQSEAVDDVCDDAQADLWRKLYHKDYAEKSGLAQFLTAAEELINARKAKMQGRGGDTSHLQRQDESLVTGREHGGYELPAGKLTIDGVREMAARLQSGERLRSASLTRVLDEAQAVLAKCPNISLIPAGTKVTVVGDLHGSYDDLLKVFELGGWPAENNTYVFNGDFVDRGDRGTEVLALLLALKVCLPEHVHLNRGNHEDSSIGRAYGFFDEVMTKYGSPQLYARIGQVFCHLPLCAVLENEVFIVHAGIPSDEDSTIYHIGAVARSNITTTVAAKWSQSRAAGDSSSRPRSLGLVEDLLWSDPVDPASEPGCENLCERNHMRGAGCRFGPDRVSKWLRKMGCSTLVRSHECVEKGWSVMNCGDNTQLYTVFSNANYQGGGNNAAILVFPGDGLGEATIVTWKPHVDSATSLSISNRARMVQLICRHKAALRGELKELAGGKADVSVEHWSSAMRKVLSLDIDFAPFCKALAGEAPEGRVTIDSFLDRYLVQMNAGTDVALSHDETLSSILLDKQDMLTALFRLLDENGDGILSKEEIFSGCSILNERLSASEQLDADKIFRLLDADASGLVRVDEFCRLWSNVPK